MRISQISSINTVQPAAQNRSKLQNQKQPSFNATLHVDLDVENFMRYLAYEASKGDKQVYQKHLSKFGKTMENLNEKLKDISGVFTVVMHPKLMEFMMEKPAATRGIYHGPQLGLIANLPILGIKHPMYEFTYKPNNPRMVEELYEGCKKLLKARGE